MKDSEISFVLQGGLSVGWDVRYSADLLRQVFPGCKVILSTQTSEAKSFEGGAAFDRVVLSPDPGGLPSVKLDGGLHNVNRQIGTTAAGLAEVTTPFAVKLRTDSYLTSRKILDIWEEFAEAARGEKAVGRSRILVCSIFTVNPRFDERLAYHVSDWFQFGRIEDLRAYWSCPPFGLRDAIWYQHHPYAKGSLRRETEFRSRYGTEQWLTLNYLFKLGFPIRHHNDTSPEIIRTFEEYLVDNFIVVHPSDIDLAIDKHSKMYRNRYFNALCYSFDDWSGLASALRGLQTRRKGRSIWPRTEREKKLYIEIRNRLRWMRHFPIQRLGRLFS